VADTKADEKLQLELLQSLTAFPAVPVHSIETILGQFMKMPRGSLATWGGPPQLVMAAQFTCYLKGHGMLEEELVSDQTNVAFNAMVNAASLSSVKSRDGG
jgi:hypothetical protein